MRKKTIIVKERERKGERVGKKEKEKGGRRVGKMKKN